MLARRVLAPVGLDDEFRFSADEVDNITTDTLLPDEFEPGQSAIAQMRPKPLFGFGLLAP